MVLIKARNKQYEVSDEVLKKIKQNSNQQIILKESFGLEQIAVYIIQHPKDLLIGYVGGKVLDRILDELINPKNPEKR